MKRVWIGMFLSVLLITAWAMVTTDKRSEATGVEIQYVAEAKAEQPPQKTWVGSWAASPQYPSAEATEGVSNQTVRMIVRPHLNGDRVRIRLSNTFGERPVTFEEGYIADVLDGATTVPSSQRQLRFNGRKSITLAAGQSIMSDPVRFAVSREQDVAISLYVKGESGPITWHRLAKQASYISEEGNFSTDHRSDPFIRRTYSWYWITGLDVLAPTDTVGIVCMGDSITDGAGSTSGANARYPDFLSQRLQAEGLSWGVMNAGISGNKILRDDPVYGPKALDRFQRDVLDQSGVTHVILLEGINDIGHTPGERNPDAIISGMRQMITQAHDRGLKIYGGTLTPYGGADYYTEEGNLVRRQVNHWIRTSGEFDGVIDFDAALRDPERPNRMLPVYDSGDHLHPSDAGYRRMAEEVNLQLFQ
ncbi:SGNH/GDSL hydrolase family protein [Desmospora activa]|uniref:Lysophospholipase L1-like esterase n=1 Tax=Desmospora activa DSM 45169 TaxID=1121389 RepID=A0A2T4Z3N0_9BACL|nr:SGNH/GDSL hydrolase family protein [Desmospora activa]PTM56494.1 lysophospholipase L1-like esterase [Desmospora activa DSM 45169]